jgi:hypothetical protein
MSNSILNSVKTGLVRVLGPGAAGALRAAGLRARDLLMRPALGNSQSDEVELIDELLRGAAVPESYCEFGFHIAEFNCARLLSRGWFGLLMDGDGPRVVAAARVLARMGCRTKALKAFLTTENVAALVHGHFGSQPLGVLSVDVDGNDYWLLQELLPLRPAMVIAEYNASFGLRSVTTPYDPVFERHAKHESGWYHGASLPAFERLCARHGYRLVKVSAGGCNAFFLHESCASAAIPTIDSHSAYCENALRNKWSGTTAEQQWARIAHLPFVTI